MGSFEQQRIDGLPPWASDDVGEAYQSVFGKRQDAELRLLKDGVLAPWLDDTPDDGLDLVGVEFDLERFPSEGDDVYRARLGAAWLARQWQGTAKGIIYSLNAFGFPNVRVIEDWEGHFADGDWYARFWVLLGSNDLTMPFLLGAGLGGTVGPISVQEMPFTLGPSTTLGSTATPDQVTAVKKQILKWKSPGSYPVRVILQFPDQVLLGVDLTMPFTMPASPQSCAWDIGRLMQDTFFIMPFQLGGQYEV